MPDVLFVKTSSLGDVIHNTALRAHRGACARNPGTRFAWVVEEAFAPLVRLHPALAEAIPLSGRNWRRSLLSSGTWREIGGFLGVLRQRRYDTVIDTQGLMKSAVVASAQPRGRVHGYDPNSVKEPFACTLYGVRHRVSWDQHAIARNRELTGTALGYQPEGAPDFGLDRAALSKQGGGNYGVLLHSTARADKEWPESNWRMLAASLGTDVDLVVPFGTEGERDRASRIAAATSRAHVPDRQPLDEMARLIAGASFVVGVDTGLLHLAAALGVPQVAIFCASDPGKTGPLGKGPMQVLGTKGAPPSVGEVVEAVARIRS